MKSIFAVVVLALIAYSAAQPVLSYNATQLVLNTQYRGSLAPQVDVTYYSVPNYFYVYLPINTFNITITFSQPTANTGDCSDFYIFSSVEGFPGGADSITSLGTIQDELYDDGNFTETFIAGDYSGSLGDLGFQVESGGYLYFALSRYYYFDFNKTCPFTFEVDVNLCPSGQIASGDGDYSEDSFCVSYTNVTAFNNTTPFFTSGVKLAGTNDYVYRFVLPDNVANVRINVGSNDSFYVYGQNRQVITDDDISGGCYTDDSDYTITCTGVQPGNYYVYIYSSETINFNLTVSVLTCTGNQVGPYCNSTYLNITEAITTGKTSVVINPESDAFGCITLPDLGTNILSLYPFGNISEFYVGRGGYPSTSYASVYVYSYPYHSVDFAFPDQLGPYDSNRICFRAYCDEFSDETCVFNLTSNSTAIPLAGSTTGMMMSTTGSMSTTGMMSTTATTTGMMSTTATTTATTTAYATGARVTTGRMTTGMMTTGMMTTAATTSTSSAMSMIPSILLVALIAIMF